MIGWHSITKVGLLNESIIFIGHFFFKDWVTHCFYFCVYFKKFFWERETEKEKKDLFINTYYKGETVVDPCVPPVLLRLERAREVSKINVCLPSVSPGAGQGEGEGKITTVLSHCLSAWGQWHLRPGLWKLPGIILYMVNKPSVVPILTSPL